MVVKHAWTIILNMKSMIHAAEMTVLRLMKGVTLSVKEKIWIEHRADSSAPQSHHIHS